ncbi:protein kinase [Singulisphaera sp. Ch08]|uniref:non-specific serine/threonine protein kinase n=1 Tax=Singulisphaera sp. Ch08 TaxID=3120278 RepID=A0AAU7C8R7_9BACT
MGPELTGEPTQEERRNQVLLAYVEALEAGREPDRSQLIAAHPDLQQDLEAFLAGHDEVARLTAPLRAVGLGDARAPFGLPREGPNPSPPGIGEIGDFRLLREVGRGGMGVVYEAEQISLRRRVALKVLPFASAIDPRRLQRFKTEALTAAHVQHEKIVPVHAVGSERGVHYYAMQFIEGQSLAALIGELRRLRDEQGPRLSPAEGEQDDRAVDADLDLRLHEPGSGGEVAHATTTISRERSADRRRYFDRAAGLARQAALALEHAHQAGIVHRDVKPGNLLLDLRGQLWVTDFGLAQVTGDPGLTITGELLGTLRYASPEQVLARRGIVDHRSDIYSLGATLYELLTLHPPFEGRDRHALIRLIAEDDPASPSDLDRTVPPELETIVLKALRKDPGDRYGTAQELADDLQRFLDARPILARRPTAAERLRAWSRRHPTAVRAGAVALILLSAASLVSTALVRGEQAKTLVEQRKAESAYRRERQRAEEAEARFRLARRAVDELIQVSEEELAHRPGMAGLRKRLLASALAYYREFVEQRRSDPDAQAELRDTTRRVETILADLAVLRAAGELYLLAQPSALNDLRLDKGQRARVADLSDRAGRRWRESFGDPANLPPPAERVRIALEQARANEEEVDAILTPSQRVRLRQIALQSEGPTAFREPEIIEALGLTPGQREQIRAIEEESLLGQRRELQAGKLAEVAGKPAMERIVAALTAEQTRRWKEMAGEPIRGTLNAFPTPFRTQRDSRRTSR